MNRTMRKILAIVLAVVCCAALLSGCGGKTAAPAATEAPAATTAPAAAAPAATEAPSAPAEPTVDYGPKVSLTMGTTGAAEDISTKAAQRFCDLVAERSDGNVTIELFPNAQLGNSSAQMEMTASGSIDFFLEGNLLGSNGVAGASISPILYSTSKENFKTYMDSELYATFEQEFLDKTGVRILAHNWYRNPTAIISKTHLETLEDCAGFKVRVPNVATSLKVFNGLGFNATPVAYNESLLSMQQGIIDGIWCTEDAIYSMGFYEVGTCVLELNLAADCMFVYACNANYEALTDAQQQLLAECAKEAGDYYSELADDILAENRAKWEAAGVETVTLSDAERERWISILKDIGHQIEDEGTWPAGLYDQVLAAVGA